MRNLIFGCGYLGLRVARKWIQQGAHVLAVTRSRQRAAELREEGIEPLVGDVTDPASLRQLSGLELDGVLYAIGFDRRAGTSMKEVYVDGLLAALDALTTPPARLIYISSTSVYGPVEGQEWIDEQTPCRPTRESGQICLQAEHVLQNHALAPRAVILRLAGIYGPQRVPRRDVLLAGQPIDADPNGYLNLIHVDDAVAAVLACQRVDQLPTSLIVSDGHPVLRSAYYTRAAQLMGAPVPQFAPQAQHPRRADHAAAAKKLSNRRLLEQLGLVLQYPSYHDGLAACLSIQEGPKAAPK